MAYRLAAVTVALLGVLASGAKSKAASKPSAGGSKACSHTGFYSKKVVPLCEQHFPDMSSKNAWVVQFYHPYVKKVHEGQAAYEALAAAPDQIFGSKVGAVDCQQNGEFCSKQGIREAPTTRVMLHGNSREFEGEHTLEALQTFVKESMKRFEEMEKALECDVKGLFNDPKRDATIPLCIDQFPPSTEAAPWIVSFYEAGDRNKDKTMKSAMNKLAEKYGNNPPKKVDAKAKVTKIRFGAVNCGDERVDCSKLGISSYPTVRFYRSGADPVDFDSFFDKDELKQWADARLKSMPAAEKVDVLKADMQESPEAKEDPEKAAGGGSDELEALKSQLEAINEQKAKAAAAEDFKEAKRLKQTQTELKEKIRKLEL